MPWTYMLRCDDGSYYVGSTWDLDGRVWQHNHDDQLGAACNRARRPVVLVWSVWYDRISDAFHLEKQIQGWSRKKREALIRGEYDALPNLSRRKAVQDRDPGNDPGPSGGVGRPGG
ncbi:putative endonuclease [Nocardioides sp. J9]|uniref:GIY-YIG nuclease family protein n=1 Tax=Nocardioides sp. J9 TaxID=935844 RepID=UPI00119EEBA9|nr:GIY-YIG nuclease family protein [Nocardioides sp. J9]TWG96446.1 putative endonuclease [Nocardioides sp. J9]